MMASATGMDTGAIHTDRLQYWESWSDWHIQSLATSQAIQLPPTAAERPFTAPAAIEIKASVVNQCLQEAIEQIQRQP
jgi:hypothetical protein